MKIKCIKLPSLSPFLRVLLTIMLTHKSIIRVERIPFVGDITLLGILFTPDINVREYRKGNQQKDNPEKMAQDEEKQNKNTTQYVLETNTNNVHKT